MSRPNVAGPIGLGDEPGVVDTDITELARNTSSSSILSKIKSTKISFDIYKKGSDEDEILRWIRFQVHRIPNLIPISSYPVDEISIGHLNLKYTCIM